MDHSPVKILIADDNPSTCSILRDYFRTIQNIMLCGIVFNGAEALEMIRLHKPDVVLLDIIMPEMDGLSVLEQLQQNAKDSSEKIPYTIVISALNSEVITQKALQLGASYYLIKPFQLDHLADRIQMLLKPDNTFSSYTDTDSDSDLPFGYVDTLEMHMVYMPYIVDGKEYPDDLGRSGGQKASVNFTTT